MKTVCYDETAEFVVIRIGGSDTHNQGIGYARVAVIDFIGQTAKGDRVATRYLKDILTDELSLFLTGQAGIRSDWFKSLEVGEGLEAGWAFGDKNSLRLGVGWETWEKLDSDEKRSHLFKIFAEKTF